RLSHRRDRRDGTRRRGEHHLPPRDRQGRRPRHRESTVRGGVPRALRQSLQGRGARLHRRGHPSANVAAAPGAVAGDAQGQAAELAAEEAREYPALTLQTLASTTSMTPSAAFFLPSARALWAMLSKADAPQAARPNCKADAPQAARPICNEPCRSSSI